MFATSSLATCGGGESVTAPGPDPEPEPPPGQAEPLPSRTDLGTLGGAASYGYDINDHNVVVGKAQTETGAFHAFRWTLSDGLQALAPLPGDLESVAVAVSSDDIVLGFSVAADQTVRPVSWTPAGTVTELPIPPIQGARLYPVDRNGQGIVIGDAPFFDDEDNRVHAWVWGPGAGLTDLATVLEPSFENYAADITEQGEVAGTVGGGLSRGYRWDPQSGPRDLGVPGGAPTRTQVTVAAVNQQGEVVGSTLLEDELGGEPPVSPFPNFRNQPFIWRDGSGFTLLPVFDPAPDGSGMAEDINNSSDVVGSAFVAASGTLQAVAWLGAGGIVNLNGSDANTSVALAVNNGRIAVGSTTLDNGDPRGTVWNIARPPTVTASTRTVQPGGPGLAKRSADGPAACLRLRTALVTKARLVACLEARRR
jgi:uncharacterized membrane protein